MGDRISSAVGWSVAAEAAHSLGLVPQPVSGDGLHTAVGYRENSVSVVRWYGVVPGLCILYPSFFSFPSSFSPSIVIASPVLGGPGTMRVVLNSNSSRSSMRSSWIEAPVLRGPESVRVCVSQAKFSFRHRRHRTVSQAKFSFRHPRTPDRFTAATASLSMYRSVPNLRISSLLSFGLAVHSKVLEIVHKGT